MRRRKIVAGNWKMNTTLERGLALTREISGIYKDEVHNDAEVILCPPFISIASMVKLLEGNDKIRIGAQNCHHMSSGAYTGSISCEMIKDAGATHVIVGHSERRQYAHEGNELLAEKVRQVLAAGMIPIYCFGETQVERKSGEHVKVIRDQIAEGLFHLDATEFGKLILAYEPVWAIGTGETATPQQANEIHAMVRKQIAEKYDQNVADAMRILYGGSVKPGNAGELFAQEDIDGGLIGGAALDARSFAEIIKQAK